MILWFHNREKDQLFTQTKKIPENSYTKVMSLLPAVDNTKTVNCPHTRNIWPTEVTSKIKNALSPVNTLPLKTIRHTLT